MDVQVPNGATKSPLRRKSSRGGWKAAIFIIFVEMADRFAYYGLAGNLIQFLTNDIGQSTAEAAKTINTWVGLSAVFPIVGAVAADSYIGRFNTIVCSSLIYLTGMVMLMLSVSVVPIHQKKPVFFWALYIIAIGDGGHKPCVQTFAADQFDDDDEAKSSFFNWWYLGIVVGASASIIAVIYTQQYMGWTAAFGLLAAIVALAFGLFLIGMKSYRKQVQSGSPFISMAQVFVAAARKWRLSGNRTMRYETGNEGKTLDCTKQLRFLDKAAMVDELDSASAVINPWRLCSVTQVEEVKLLLSLIPITLTCLMYSAIIVQVHTFFTKQGSVMNRSIGPHFTVPPASLQTLVGLTILVFIPIYDRILVPIARKVTKHPSGITVLQRIGLGLFFSVLLMIVAALVEGKRASVSKSMEALSIWWLLPQYMIMGVADAFAIVGLQQLFYDQIPEMMRSIGAAVSLSIVGFGNFVNTAIISVVQKISSKHGSEWLVNDLDQAHLNDFYWLLAGLSAINLCIYVWVAKSFVYKKRDDVKYDRAQEDEAKLDGGV